MITEENRIEMNDMSTPTTQHPTLSAPIKVIGVGGGGSNAVNTMYDRGIQGVDFIVCNTDAQALDASPVPVKVQLGATLTGGQGAGSLPDVGRNAAIETLEDKKSKKRKEQLLPSFYIKYNHRIFVIFASIESSE